MSLGAGLMAGGGALSAGSSILGGINQAGADRSIATLYQQQANNDLVNAGEQVNATDQRAVQTISAASAAAGASGVTQAGSPALAKAATINRANAADVYNRYAGKMKSISDAYQGQLMDYKANQDEISGFMNAGASLLTAGGHMAMAGATP